MSPLVLAIQHCAEDPPGRLGAWLVEAGCELQVIRCDAGEPLPGSLTGYAGLMVLGGPMGAYDDEQFPWLTPVKALLREAAVRDLPTLGICLGHQLLAVATGGRVVVADTSQTGVTGVGRTPAGESDSLFGPLDADPVAVHWNNDMVVDPPPGAEVLSHSAVGIQSFRLGARVWGLQFHPEVDPETAAQWADGDVRDGRLTTDEANARLAGIQAQDERLNTTWGAFAHRFAAAVSTG